MSELDEGSNHPARDIMDTFVEESNNDLLRQNMVEYYYIRSYLW